MMDYKIVEKIIENASPEINRSLEISREEYEKRWSEVQAAMKQKGYELCYACGSELDRSDVAWLAGIFDPIIERYGILVPLRYWPAWALAANSMASNIIFFVFSDRIYRIDLMKLTLPNTTKGCGRYNF